MPTAQLLQEDEPAGLKVLARQGTQEAGALAMVPAGHKAAQVSEEAALYIPSAQEVQNDAPVASECVPAGQEEQEPGAMAIVPGGQEVDVKSQDAAAEVLYVPSEHTIADDEPAGQ
jgi:hypothetical protein